MSSPFFRSPAFKAALKRTYASQPGGPTIESAKKGAESAFDKAQKTAVEVLTAAQKAAGPTGDRIASRLSCTYRHLLLEMGGEQDGLEDTGGSGDVDPPFLSFSEAEPLSFLSFPSSSPSSFTLTWCPAISNSVIYNAKLVGALARQVYVAEKLAPPTSVGEIVGGWSTVWARGTSWDYWFHAKSSGEWKTLAIYVSLRFFFGWRKGEGEGGVGGEEGRKEGGR